mmetsp:Transcript_27581/g.31753  ORF Transcript_27581/g.31753 Transcript_27581/m.31753 type:complete len:82 (+) Transcript_27581:930-1175(+)
MPLLTKDKQKFVFKNMKTSSRNNMKELISSQAKKAPGFANSVGTQEISNQSIKLSMHSFDKQPMNKLISKNFEKLMSQDSK